MNTFWEAGVCMKPSCECSDAALWQFIYDKYVLKKYVNAGIRNPINNIASPLSSSSAIVFSNIDSSYKRDLSSSFDEGITVNKLPLMNITNKKKR